MFWAPATAAARWMSAAGRFSAMLLFDLFPSAPMSRVRSGSRFAADSRVAWESTGGEVAGRADARVPAPPGPLRPVALAPTGATDGAGATGAALGAAPASGAAAVTRPNVASTCLRIASEGQLACTPFAANSWDTW